MKSESLSIEGGCADCQYKRLQVLDDMPLRTAHKDIREGKIFL